MTAEFGPCADWPVYWTCDVSTESAAATGYAAAFATRTLWALSGRRFGTCEVTLRPCRKDCYDIWPRGWFPWPVTDPLLGGAGRFWYPLSCGSCGGDCSCGSVSETWLPAPVNRIVEVKIDGTPMATGAYRVDNHRILVRTDGSAWPVCNDLSEDDTQPGTWSVTALYGEDVPTGAALAMGELVCEILKASRGEDCRLPAGVTQLARQGVTISYPDVGQLLKEGRTGLYLVDMFLAAENPAGLAQRSRTYRVDGPQVRRAGT